MPCEMFLISYDLNIFLFVFFVFYVLIKTKHLPPFSPIVVMCGKLTKKETQTKKGTCKDFGKVKDKTDIKIKQDDGYTYKYLLETNCVTKEDILKKFPIAEKSVLIQEYDKKEVELNEKFASKIKIPEVQGKVYREEVCSTDIGKKYGIAVINIEVDEYTKIVEGRSKNVKGITKKVDYHIIDLETGKELYKLGPTTWRDGDGACPINYELAYKECKILKETDSKVVFGLNSMTDIKILEFSKKKGEVKTLEEFDLSEYNKAHEVQEKIDKALGLELNKNGYLDQSSLLSKILEGTVDWGGHAGSPILAHEDFAVQAVYQGIDASSATVKLVVKDVGIFDINKHVRKHESSSNQYGFFVEKPSIEFVDDKIVVKYHLDEKTGYNFDVVNSTSHAIVIDTKLLGPEYAKLVKIKEKIKLLSHGNLHKIPIMKQGFGKKDEELSNYAYSVKQFTHKDEKYVLVTKMIDVESYQLLDLGAWEDTIAGYEAQLKMGLYKVKETSEGEIELECVDEITTPSTERKEVVYHIERNRMDKEEFVIKPVFKIEGDEVKVILDAINPGSEKYKLVMDKKEFVLKF